MDTSGRRRLQSGEVQFSPKLPFVETALVAGCGGDIVLCQCFPSAVALADRPEAQHPIECSDGNFHFAGRFELHRRRYQARHIAQNDEVQWLSVCHHDGIDGSSKVRLENIMMPDEA